MCPVVAIHPINEELHFLRKLLRGLRKDFPSDFLYLRLEGNLASHEACLAYLSTPAPSGAVCFFAHAQSDRILGCRFKDWSMEHPRRYVHDERGLFIGRQKIQVLKGKKVFCLACNSNRLGKRAINIGAKVFIGFEEVNFERKDIWDKGRANKLVVSFTKWKLRTAVYYALKRGIEKNLTFSSFKSYLDLMLANLADDLVISRKNDRKAELYRRAAGNLYKVRSGMQLQGDGDVTML